MINPALSLLAQWALLAADHDRSGRFMVFTVNYPTGKLATTLGSAHYIAQLERENSALCAIFSTGRRSQLLEQHGFPV
jgi:hypothetical protein